MQNDLHSFSLKGIHIQKLMIDGNLGFLNLNDKNFSF